jgi:putative transcriptional regulator
MNRFATFLALACCAVPFGANADEDLGVGKLLVATEDVVGSDFVETVILLLHYDESGALGLVINKPLDVAPKEVLPDMERIGAYQGPLYWGGPVREFTLRALLLADDPPVDAVHIFGAVYGAALDEALPEGATDAAHLRFFLGYAGWSPGQLEREVFYGSWQIVSASEEIVFAEDPGTIWHHLQPPRQYRAALD